MWKRRNWNFVREVFPRGVTQGGVLFYRKPDPSSLEKEGADKSEKSLKIK